jgi:hypothetical protein
MFDGFNNKVRLKWLVFQDEPARTFRHIFPQDKKRKYTKEPDCKEVPPVGNLSEKYVENGSKRPSQMPGTVNSNIDSSTILWRKELVNCSENGSELAAYTRMRKMVPDAGQEATTHKKVNIVGDD